MRRQVVARDFADDGGVRHNLTAHDIVHNQAGNQTIGGSVYHAPVTVTNVSGSQSPDHRSQSSIPLRLDPLAKRQILFNSLRFDQMGSRHDTIRMVRPRTCQWLLQQSEYHDWLNDGLLADHHGFLWIKGNPGTGKSTITKFAFTDMKAKHKHVIAFFFNARGDEIEKSSLGLYRSLLSQILTSIPELQSVLDVCSITSDSAIVVSRAWTVEMLEQLLRNVIEKLSCSQQQLLCFIDALDECEDDQARDMVMFFEELSEIAVSSGSRLRIFFSSRHYPHIDIDHKVTFVLEEQQGHLDGITSYLISALRIGRGRLADQIQSEIIERASGIYLWVVIVVQILNKEWSRGRVHALKQCLDELPDDLGKLFHDILMRDGQPEEDVILCFQWLLLANRSLTLEQLYARIRAGTETDLDILSEDITADDMSRFILNCSRGLAEETKTAPKRVQFIHESVREFFLKESLLQTRVFGSVDTFRARGHDRLKECCYDYYTKADRSRWMDLNRSLDLPVAFPMLEYAVQNMFYHSDKAHDYGLSQGAFMETLDLDQWISISNLFQNDTDRYSPDISLLYVVAEQGLPNLITVELDRGSTPLIAGGRHRFPLFAAQANGGKEALQALLSSAPLETLPRAVNVASQIDIHQAVIELLEGRGKRSLFTHGHTPLVWAANNGKAALFKCLLAQREDDVSRQLFENKPLPLQETLQARGWGLFEYFSESDPAKMLTILHAVENTEYRERVYGAVASWAIQNGVVDLIDFMLGIGYNCLSDPMTNGSSCLHLAVNSCSVDMVRRVIQFQREKINLLNSYGQTSLMYATRLGYTDIVEALLQADGVRVNKVDSLGQSALFYAAQVGAVSIVRALSGRASVDVNLPDRRSRTPLYMACNVSGTDEVRIRALGRVPSKLDRAELTQADSDRYTNVVKLLLERKDIDIHKAGHDGRTPIQCAIERGATSIVNLLSGRARSVYINAIKARHRIH